MLQTEPQPTVRRLYPRLAPVMEPAPTAEAPVPSPSPSTSTTPGVRLGRVHGVGASRLRHHDPTPTRTGDNQLASRYAQRLLEVLSGHRVCEQLTAIATEEVHNDVRTLVRRRCLLGPNGSLPVLWKVFDDSPAPGVLEVAASVRVGERLEMLAFRLELRRIARRPDGTWRFTALETRW